MNNLLHSEISYNENMNLCFTGINHRPNLLLPWESIILTIQIFKVARELLCIFQVYIYVGLNQ